MRSPKEVLRAPLNQARIIASPYGAASGIKRPAFRDVPSSIAALRFREPGEIILRDACTPAGALLDCDGGNIFRIYGYVKL